MFKIGDKVRIKILSHIGDYKDFSKYPNSPYFNEAMFIIAKKNKVYFIIDSWVYEGIENFILDINFILGKNELTWIWYPGWLEKAEAQQLELF